MSFSFQTSLSHIECSQQAWYYSFSSIHIYQSHIREPLFNVGEVASRMKFSSLHILNDVSTLGKAGG